MMKLAIARAFADPSVTAILVDPRDRNLKACRFYENLGFEFVVKRCFDDEYCAVYRLIRQEDTAAVRKVRSATS